MSRAISESGTEPGTEPGTESGTEPGTAGLSKEWIPALGCLAAAGVVVGLGDLRAEAGLFLGVAMLWAALACLGAAWTRDVRLALAIGVLLRIALVASPATLSDDLFRYLWEGRVQLAGFDPFVHAPSDAALADLRNDTWAAVAHRDISTIYPPAALFLFRAVAFVHESATAWKALVAAADIALMFAIARECKSRGVGIWAPALYALHPLPIIEAAGSGHLESIALLFLVLGLRRGSSFLVGVGALVKVLPAVAWVAQLRQKRAVLGIIGTLGLAALLSWPFVDAGPTLLRGFRTYAEHWAFNGALFPPLESLFGDHARGVGVGLGGAYCLFAAWRLKDPAALMMHVAVALVLLSPVVHPWYVLWILVPALLRGAWPWVLLATTTLLSYAVLVGYDPQVPGSWEEPTWVVWLEYPPMLLLLAFVELRKRRSKASVED